MYNCSRGTLIGPWPANRGIPGMPIPTRRMEGLNNVQVTVFPIGDLLPGQKIRAEILDGLGGYFALETGSVVGVFANYVFGPNPSVVMSLSSLDGETIDPQDIRVGVRIQYFVV
jgi:hypothetical protein